jgi:PAS domain S-box-containing protein
MALRAFGLMALAVALPRAWQLVVAGGAERGAGIAVLAVGVAAVVLGSGSRRVQWAGFVAVALAAMQLLARPQAGDEFGLRPPFAALTGLAALGILLHLLDGPRTRRAAALLAGIALSMAAVRLFAVFDQTSAIAAHWPPVTLFAPLLALALVLAWPLVDELRRTMDAPRATAHVLALLLLGLVAMVLIGHLLGSPLLTRGIGPNVLTPQAALLGVAAIGLLRAALERWPSYRAWQLGLCAGVAVNVLYGGLPADSGVLSGVFGQLLLPDGIRPGRALVISFYTIALLLACHVIRRRDSGPWARRAAWATGLVGVMAASISMSGVIAGALFSVDPILGADRLSFLGLLALMGVGTALFCAALTRCSVRERRMEALPAAVVAAALAVTISLWGAATRQTIDAIAATSDVALEAMSRTLVAELESQATDFSRLSAQMAHDSAYDRDVRTAAAGRALASRYATLARMSWLGDDGTLLSYATPQRNGIGVAKVTVRADLVALEEDLLRLAATGRTPALGAAASTPQLPRSLGLASRSEGPAAGTLVALFVVPHELLPAFVGRPVQGFGAEVVIDGINFGVVGARAVPAPDGPLAVYARKLARPVLGMPVRLAVWPTDATVERLRSRLPQAILLSGGLIALLLAVVSVLGGGAREGARAEQSARAAAEASQQEIVEVLEGLPDAFFAFDREWRFVQANRAAERLIDRPRAQFLGRVLWDTSAEAERDFGPTYRRVMQTRVIESLEFYYRSFRVWLAVQAFPLPEGIGVVARDISAERATLDNLRQREADLAQALEIADLARFEMDAQERLRWSGAAARVLGRREADLPATRAEWRAIWHPDDAATLLPVAAERIRSGLGIDIEHRILWPDGSVRWVHSVARVLDVDSPAPRIVATVQDITVQKLQARAVLERDRFFEASRELFCILDPQGRFIEANPALCRLLEVGRDELLGRFAFDYTHSADREQVLTRFDRARAAQPRASGAVRNVTRSGEIRWVQWSSSPSADGDLYVAGHDMTEYMVAEAAREQALRELQSRNEELQQFAYIASHDLQEPLRKIQAFGDRLRSRFESLLGDDGLDYLARMDRAAQRMSTLISDLLDYSRVSSTGEPFVPVALADVLADVLGDLEESIRASGGSVDSGPLPVIDADRVQMAQLLQNLIGNALKYRQTDRAPRVSVHADVFASGQPDSGEPGEAWMRMRVSDNGIGFDPAHSERIFAPFQRLHGRAEYAGTGIGLAIVRKIVERHGGRVRADGRVGHGATFIVELPLRHRAAHDAVA